MRAATHRLRRDSRESTAKTVAKVARVDGRAGALRTKLATDQSEPGFGDQPGGATDTKRLPQRPHSTIIDSWCDQIRMARPQPGQWLTRACPPGASPGACVGEGAGGAPTPGTG